VLVDHTYGSENSISTTIWTTSPEVTLNEGKFSGSYILKSENTGTILKKYIFGSEHKKIMQYKGNFAPTIGWINNRPAPAIFVEQPADDSWLVTVWSLENASDSTLKVVGQPHMQKWKGNEEWEILLPLNSGVINIWRENDKICVNEPEGTFKVLRLKNSPQLDHKVASIHESYKYALDKYQKSKYNLPSRRKGTNFLILIFIVQEISFYIYRNRIYRYYNQLRIINICGWLATILFLHILYF
jgi:hypothetical protein